MNTEVQRKRKKREIIRIFPTDPLYPYLKQMNPKYGLIYVPKYWSNATWRKVPQRGRKGKGEWFFKPNRFASAYQLWVELVRRGFAGKFLRLIPDALKRGIPYYLYQPFQEDEG